MTFVPSPLRQICPASGACHEWLESGPQNSYLSFCPNAALAERLTVRSAR